MSNKKIKGMLCLFFSPLHISVEKGQSLISVPKLSCCWRLAVSFSCEQHTLVVSFYHIQLNNATTTKMKKKVLSDCYSVERAGRSSCLF